MDQQQIDRIIEKIRKFSFKDFIESLGWECIEVEQSFNSVQISKGEYGISHSMVIPGLKMANAIGFDKEENYSDEEIIDKFINGFKNKISVDIEQHKNINKGVFFIEKEWNIFVDPIIFTKHGKFGFYAFMSYALLSISDEKIETTQQKKALYEEFKSMKE
jgi:hypothetical protein